MAALDWKNCSIFATDIVFDIMYSFIKSKRRRKVVLVSGDGDYIKTVRFLMGGEPFRKSTSSK